MGPHGPKSKFIDTHFGTKNATTRHMTNCNWWRGDSRFMWGHISTHHNSSYGELWYLLCQNVYHQTCSSPKTPNIDCKSVIKAKENDVDGLYLVVLIKGLFVKFYSALPLGCWNLMHVSVTTIIHAFTSRLPKIKEKVLISPQKFRNI